MFVFNNLMQQHDAWISNVEGELSMHIPRFSFTLKLNTWKMVIFSSSDKALLVHRLCEFHQIVWVLGNLHGELCSVLWVAFTFIILIQSDYWDNLWRWTEFKSKKWRAVALDDLGSSGQCSKSTGCDFYFPTCPGAGEVELIMYGRSPLSQGPVM